VFKLSQTYFNVL